jgi:hypothetical protein
MPLCTYFVDLGLGFIFDSKCKDLSQVAYHVPYLVDPDPETL